jgi:electron transfer flavoprotein alpha subunit
LLCKEIGARGVQEIALLQVPEPEKSPDLLAKALAWHIQSAGLSDVVAVGTSSGRDLISRVAAILKAPLLSDCVKLDLPAGIASKYIFSGRMLASYEMPGPTNLYALRPHIWKEGRQCADHNARLTLVKPPSQPASVRVVRRETIEETPDLFEARVIVGTGRSIGSVENLSIAREIAQKLGGAVAVTRSAVDAGYAPPSIQIGLTGSVVSPDLYIACGISGSIHHMAGVKTARTVVAINKDRTAPIFKWADYGLEGDIFEVLPLLSKLLGPNS